MELKTYTALCRGALNPYHKQSLPLSTPNPHHNWNHAKARPDRKPASCAADEN